MKSLLPLFLGIFGTFAFSWLGLTVVPNLQIGSLNPQTDEEGGDVYPAPPSGMALRGARVYAANGCVYCHSQQVRPDYGGSDIERKWGERRSAPRDYIFEPIVLLGKKRTGPDLANVGHQPSMQEAGAAAPVSPATAGPSPATTIASPAATNAPPAAATTAPSAASASPVTGSASPAAASASPAAASKPSAAASASPVNASAPPASADAPAANANASPAAMQSAPAGAQPAPNVVTAAPSLVADVQSLTAEGKPIPYTAAWHHRHLYNPRSVNRDSTMPAFRFLYQKRRISGTASPEALNFVGNTEENPETGWEIVPSYDAQCLVAYLMSRDQSHPLKEAKSSAVAAAPSPAAAKEAKK